MANAAFKKRGGGGEATDFIGEHFHQILFRVGPPVGEQPFEMVPDAFVRIQRGGIGRKGDQVQTPGAGKKLPDRFRFVDLAVVEKDDQMTANLLKDLAQEAGDLLALNIVLEELAMEGAVETPRTHGDARDGRDAVVQLVMSEDRCLPNGTPCLAHRRDQQETGFVDKHDVGRQPCGVFFTAGQTFRFQSSMADSDRSMARRSGFWWLQPS